MGTFQRSITVLFAIGLNMYLGLGVDAPHIPTQYPVSCTQDPANIQLRVLHGAITLYSVPFQETYNIQAWMHTGSL